MQEVWRPVVGWEGLYEVSSLGQVKSLARRYWTEGGRAPHWCNLKERILKPGTNVHGYLHVVLSREGKQHSYTVHRLVADAFLGTRPAGMDTCHGPLGKLVNTPNNLSYGTRQENMRDCFRDGTHQRGERGSAAKLTQEQVNSIRALKEKMTQKAVAAMYGISRSNVSMIWNNKCWVTWIDA